jgi:hypothetical protein
MYYTHYLNIWDDLFGGSELFFQLEDLHVEWREVGNNLTEFYRQIERQLNISPELSALPLQDYED